MVHTMVLPVLTMLRTVRMTMAAALASRPAESCVQFQGHIVAQDSMAKHNTCVQL